MASSARTRTRSRPLAEQVQEAEQRAALASAKVKIGVAKAQQRVLRLVGSHTQTGAMPGWGKNQGVRGGRPGGRAMNASGSYQNGPERLRKANGPNGMAIGGSADNHLSTNELRRMRRDAQEALRNDPMASLLVHCLVVMVVGDGPTIKPKTSSSAFNEKKKKLFEAWACNEPSFDGKPLEPCDARCGNGPDLDGGGPGAGLTLDERLATLVFSACSDGTILDVFTPEGSLSMVEAERLTGPRGPGQQNRFENGKGGWVNGIELDAGGRYIRAGIGAWSPEGSVVRFGEKDLGFADLRDGSAFLFNQPRSLWANATVAEPGLARITERLDHTSDYDWSVREAARVHACLTAIITSGNPEMFASMPGMDVARATASAAGTAVGSTDVQKEIVAGMMINAGTDAKVTPMQGTQPTAQYEGFMRWQYGVAAADLGVALLLALMDPTGTNYSGFRAMLALAWRNFERWMRSVRKYLRFVERFKTAQWIREGRLDPVADWDAASDWIFPPMPSLDPFKEVQGLKEAIDAKLRSRTEAITLLSGRSREDVDAELGEDQESADENGIREAAPAGAFGSAGGQGSTNDDGDGEDMPAPAKKKEIAKA